MSYTEAELHHADAMMKTLGEAVGLKLRREKPKPKRKEVYADGSAPRLRPDGYRMFEGPPLSKTVTPGQPLPDCSGPTCGWVSRKPKAKLCSVCDETLTAHNRRGDK